MSEGILIFGSIVARTLARDLSRIGVSVKRVSNGASFPEQKLSMHSETKQDWCKASVVRVSI